MSLLFRPFSVLDNRFGPEAGVIHWYAARRATPAAPYQDLILDYATLRAEDRSGAEAFVDQTLTTDECEALRAYALRAWGLEVYAVGVCAPVRAASAACLPEGRAESVVTLRRDDSRAPYPLEFEVRGLCVGAASMCPVFGRPSTPVGDALPARLAAR